MIPEAKRINWLGGFCTGEGFEIKSDFGENETACAERISRGLKGTGHIPLTLTKTDSEKTEYCLRVRQEGVEILASANGIFPAMSSLQNIIEDGKIPLCDIRDYARFEHRGYMQDDARHFQGAGAAVEILEIMFRFKMNVFHWHISDDQGFRLNLPGYERLARQATGRLSSNVGGYTKNRPDNVPYSAVYSRDEMETVLKAARERGIRVIPEIDMPGHFSAILSAYPEFTCDGVKIDVPGRYGVLENTLCLGKKEAREFAKQLALDVACYFKADTVHIGFDEIKTGKMCACPDCLAEAERRGLKSPEELLPLFREEVKEFLSDHGIGVIAWDDENSLSGPADDITLMHWRPESNLRAAKRAHNGQKTICCDFYHHYADYPYCMTPLKKTYLRDPVFPGVRDDSSIVGVETPLWAEFVRSADKREMNAFYRIAAVSQNAWNRPAERPAYEDFKKELTEREAYYFGKRLDVPESILNPPFAVRLVRLKKCLYEDADLEVKLWKAKEEA